MYIHIHIYMYVRVGIFLVTYRRTISPTCRLLNGRAHALFMSGLSTQDAVARKLHMPRHPLWHEAGAEESFELLVQYGMVPLMIHYLGGAERGKRRHLKVASREALKTSWIILLPCPSNYLTIVYRTNTSSVLIFCVAHYSPTTFHVSFFFLIYSYLCGIVQSVSLHCEYIGDFVICFALAAVQYLLVESPFLHLNLLQITCGCSSPAPSLLASIICSEMGIWPKAGQPASSLSLFLTLSGEETQFFCWNHKL